MTISLEDRFNAAIADSTAAGVPVIINDAAPCCRSCYVADNPRAVYTLSQFGTVKFRRDVAVYAEEVEVECSCTDDEYDYEGERVIREGEMCGVCTGRDDGTEEVSVRIGSLWVYFLELASATTFCAALTANGIPFLWDGSADNAIEVVLNG